VVGFGVPGDEAEQLRDIATAGGGEYFDAKTGADLDGYFREHSEAMQQTWDAFACELRNGFHDTLCDENRCNDATVFRIPEEQREYEYGSPEYEALQDLYEQHSELREENYGAFNEAYGVGS
jgi:hypothetical protein